MMIKRFLRPALLSLALLLASFPTLAGTLYIEEFNQLPGGGYQAGQMPSLTHQTVAIGGSSTRSNAFSSATVLIRVEVDSVCSVQIGTTTPTATTTSMRMVAGQTEYFLVHPGDKLAVISNS